MLRGRVVPHLVVVSMTLALMVPAVMFVAPARPAFAQGSVYVDKFVSRDCGGNSPCYHSIQAGVSAAGSGDTVYVYPATYNEGVDLSVTSGDLTLVTVNSAGVPTPGTVTVQNPGVESEIYTTSAYDGDLIIDGFVLHSVNPAIDVRTGGGHSVEIRNVTVTGVQDDGIRVSADGNVTITNCTASNNDGIGIWVENTGGDVTITNCTANDNGGGVVYPGGVGILLTSVLGEVQISNCTANNNVCSSAPARPQSYPQCGWGIYLDSVQGAVDVSNCTANENSAGGAGVGWPGSAVSIRDSVFRDNGTGVQFTDPELGATLQGSIICGNAQNGLSTVVDGSVNAEGNWWGCGGGPGTAGCDTVASGGPALDYTPWISTISSSAAPDPVTVGEPTVVTFQFLGGPPVVYLGRGPGDLRGPAPFTVSTDNGRLDGNGASVHKFIHGTQGSLQTTLVPETEGTATVTVTGPCGLAGLEGATAAVGVLQEEFVPEPGTILLLGGGLTGLAGHVGLKLRKR